jgi:hypothetical protein
MLPVADPDPPAPPPLTPEQLADRFAKAPWADIDKSLRKLCFRLLERQDDDAADDLIGDATAAVWRAITTGEGPRWDPIKNPNLKCHLAWVVRSGFRHGIARPYERDRVRFDEGSEPVAVEPTGDADRVLQTRERMRRQQARIERTREKLEGMTLAVFNEVVAETFKPETFAAKSGVSVTQANDARRRAKYAWETELAAHPDSSGSQRAAAQVAEDQPFEGESQS